MPRAFTFELVGAIFLRLRAAAITLSLNPVAGSQREFQSADVQGFLKEGFFPTSSDLRASHRQRRSGRIFFPRAYTVALALVCQFITLANRTGHDKDGLPDIYATQ